MGTWDDSMLEDHEYPDIIIPSGTTTHTEKPTDVIVFYADGRIESMTLKESAVEIIKDQPFY